MPVKRRKPISKKPKPPSKTPKTVKKPPKSVTTPLTTPYRNSPGPKTPPNSNKTLAQTCKTLTSPPPISSRPLFLDSQATTPLDPRVLDAMMPFMTTQFGNPHSKSHGYGGKGLPGLRKG
jgi:cysteine desulfurase